MDPVSLLNKYHTLHSLSSQIGDKHGTIGSPRSFTSLSIAGQTLGLGLWGTLASVPSLIGGLLLQFLSVNATAKTCLHAAATDHAVAHGMGR